MPRCSAITREARNELLVARRLALAVEAVVNDRPTGSPATAMFQAVCTHVSRDAFGAAAARPGRDPQDH